MWGQINWVVVNTTTPGAPDAHGRGGVATVSTELNCRADFLNATETNTAERFAEHWESVLQCPPEAPVKKGDQVVMGQYRLDGVTPTNVYSQLWGTWKVATVRRNPLLLRVILRRDD